jgi:RsmE family RNA methyltransferase
VNIILFDSQEIQTALPLTDVRSVHITDILKRQIGEEFDVGLLNGPRGKASIVSQSEAGLNLKFVWGQMPQALDPITLVIGMPRPQTARKILSEAAALGVKTLYFVSTEKADPSYAMSTLWSTGEYKKQIRSGAEQAFCTRLPEVIFNQSLEDVWNSIDLNTTKIALDNYESPEALSQAKLSPPCVIAIGSERGWSLSERNLFRSTNTQLCHLGERVLRTETACVASVSIIKAALGLM